ncbi:MAG: acetylxylan esterase [Spirochaetes bacterium]|nr:acetylxylan esterase [Spirochaetota bacterium]
MPLIDKPLPELYKYEGRNPKPSDHAAFWDKALASMHAIDPKIELIPAEFKAPNADCFHMYFTGDGGARVYAKLLKPKNPAKKHPAVVVFHGYSGSSGDWNGYLSYVGQGFTVAALDCRGQGGRSEDVGGIHGTTQNGHIIRGLNDSPDKLLFKSIYLDTAQLARIVMNMDDVDETRVGAFGGSQGGGLTLACASLEPRIKRAAPTFPFLCDYRRVWEMDQAANAYAELKTFFRNFDPRHEREDEIFTRLGYIDVQFLTPRIKGEILMGTGLMDNVCPPSTQFAAYNKITSKKNVLIYPDFGHEGLPGFPDRVFEFMMGL